MLSKMPSCMSRHHPKRFENQTGTCPRKWVNSTHKETGSRSTELGRPVVNFIASASHTRSVS
jgi:hypothetical protein